LSSKPIDLKIAIKQVLSFSPRYLPLIKSSF